jgi:hypothetical protein
MKVQTLFQTGSSPRAASLPGCSRCVGTFLLLLTAVSSAAPPPSIEVTTIGSDEDPNIEISYGSPCFCAEASREKMTSQRFHHDRSVENRATP